MHCRHSLSVLSLYSSSLLLTMRRTSCHRHRSVIAYYCTCHCTSDHKYHLMFLSINVLTCVTLQASFVYMFRPSESFYARPFGLTINIYYKDTVSSVTTLCLPKYHMHTHTHTHTHTHIHTHTQDDNDYRDAVFNNTVNIMEVEEGFDAET